MKRIGQLVEHMVDARAHAPLTDPRTGRRTGRCVEPPLPDPAQAEPPRAVEVLLAGFGADPASRDALLGDLAEEFARRSAQDGRAAARRWYLTEAMQAVPHLLRSGLRGRPSGAASPVASLGYVGRVVVAAYGLVLALAAAIGAAAGLGLRLAGVALPALRLLSPPTGGAAALARVEDWTHWFQAVPHAVHGPALELGFALGAAGAVLGGTWAARFGRRAPMACALALGVAAAAASVGMAVVGAAWPAWYRAVAPLVAFAGATLGGVRCTLRQSEIPPEDG